jgi:hypothetical protein
MQALAGLLAAVYALALQQAGIEKVLWLDKTQHRGVATGCFINRNNLAAYANLALLCWLALLIRGQRQGAAAPTWRARFVGLVENPDLRQLWRLAAAAVVLTHSLVVFGPHIPAIAATCAALLGIGAGRALAAGGHGMP